jgi:succinate dehydrogenase assembly factor 1
MKKGIQHQVIQLYRDCLRAIKKKPKESQHNFTCFVQREFRKNQSISRKEFTTIEYLIRKGQRQLLLLQSDQIHSISLFCFCCSCS